jgi:hypothetical protein
VTTRKPVPAPAPLTFAEMKAKLRRPRRIVELVLDAESAAQIDALTALLDRIPPDDEATVKSVAAELRKAESVAEVSRVHLTLEALSHRAYAELQDAHKATPERLAEVEAATGERWAFDPDAFAPHLVHAQLVSPRPADDEEFTAFWDSLSDGQMRRLWTAALGVQLQVTTLGPRNVQAAALK